MSNKSYTVKYFQHVQHSISHEVFQHDKSTFRDSLLYLNVDGIRRNLVGSSLFALLLI